MERPKERESHKEAGWSEVRRSQKKVTNQRENHQETTFFVENLPDAASNNILWKSFGKIGRLSDAYVARKKDSGGNRFGFLRYLNARDIDEILREANEIRVLETVVRVSLAKFDRSHRKIYHPPPASFPKPSTTWIPKPVANGIYRRMEGINLAQGGISYSDIVKNKRPSEANRKSIRILGEGGLLPKHWVGKAIIGDARGLEELQNVQKLLGDIGLQDVGSSYLGGMKVLLTFHDGIQAKEFVSNGRERWQQVFESVKIWDGEMVPKERIARLYIRGVPLKIRNDETFNEIGGVLGKVIEGSKFSWSNFDAEMGSCLVLVRQWSKIDETIIVQWKDKEFDVKVSEEGDSWRPKFNVGNLEDGEFRYGPPEKEGRPVNEMEIEKSKSKGSGLENHVHGEDHFFNAGIIDFGNSNMEKVSSDSESTFSMNSSSDKRGDNEVFVGELGGGKLGGDMSSVGDKDHGESHAPYSNNNEGNGRMFIGDLNLPPQMHFNFEVDSSDLLNSGKKKKADTSKRKGPRTNSRSSKNLFLGWKKSFMLGRSLDGKKDLLGNRISSRSKAHSLPKLGESGTELNGPPDIQDEGVPDDPTRVLPIPTELDGENNVDIGLSHVHLYQQKIHEEVDATLNIASLIGIDLSGYEGLVEKQVMEDGVL